MQRPEEEGIGEESKLGGINNSEIAKIPPVPEEAREEISEETKFIQRMQVADDLSGQISGLENNDDISLEGFLKGYFEEREDLEFSSNPEELANEIITLEEWLKTQSIAEDHIKPVRDALFRTVLSEHISAETIIKGLRGGIKIEESTENTDTTAKFEMSGGSCSITLFRPFFTESSDKQINHFQHEIGHILSETYAIWGKGNYDKFLDAVRELDDDIINGIKEECPELVMIYEMIKDPAKAVFFRGYISRTLGQIEGSGNEPEARVKAAREMTAELIANYLQSDGSELSFFESRLKNSGQDLTQLCLERSEIEDISEFKEKYELSDEELTPSIILEKLSTSDLFNEDLSMQKALQAKLSQTFEKKTGLIPEPDQTQSIEIFEDGDYGYYDGGGQARNSDEAGTQTSGKTEDVFNWFFRFLTGRSD